MRDEIKERTRPEWTGEVIGKLHLFNISKQQFAEMINVLCYTSISIRVPHNVSFLSVKLHENNTYCKTDF